MKTLTEILEIVIESDAALASYEIENLPAAAKARLQNTLVSLEKTLSSEELDVLEKWTGGSDIWGKHEASFQEQNSDCCYYIYGDGSLYFRSSGDSEVWSDAFDFADEKIINGYDGELDEMDANLLKHLGFEEEVAQRGVRA